MNIERATELTRQAHAIIGSITPYQFDEDDRHGETMRLRPGFTEDAARRILNAEGWLSGASAGPDAALANDISKGVFIFTTSLSEGVAVAWSELRKVVTGYGMPKGWPEFTRIADALVLIEDALEELALVPGSPLLMKLARQ